MSHSDRVLQIRDSDEATRHGRQAPRSATADKLRDEGGSRTDADGRTPRVSILIPNYNNGRSSSTNGDYDFIGLLLQSLWDTLADDPTPYEIIVCDDGSTDDGLQTLTDWARRSYPDGRPFLELIEQEHCGVLSKTANMLSSRARGDILARLDGDVTCLTRHWVTQLCELFDSGPRHLGIVGPKQLRPDGKIHAFGDWVLHPNGYVHIANGFDRHSVRFPIEVDHVMGCFYCCRKKVWEDLGGYDETFLRGQTVDLGLRARLEGWVCIAVPHIEYIHAHALRQRRQTTADSNDGVKRSMKVFEEKWGFSRIAPDLDVVRQRYGGTPLLWNARWFATGGDQPVGNSQPLEVDSSAWQTYSRDKMARAHVDVRVSVAEQVIKQTGSPKSAALIGCGDGLVVHMLAGRGLQCIGIDRDAAKIDLAIRCTKDREYPGPVPRFLHQEHPSRLPLADGEIDLLLIYDEMEQHPNPVALLHEAARVLPPGKPMTIVSKRKPMREDCPADPDHRYHWDELLNQIAAVGGFQLAVDIAAGNQGPLMVVVTLKAGLAAEVQGEAA